jgi:hypothetical protein
MTDQRREEWREEGERLKALDVARNGRSWPSNAALPTTPGQPGPTAGLARLLGLHGVPGDHAGSCVTALLPTRGPGWRPLEPVR